ncbi:MAG: hypothetical protein K8R25_08145 [Methanosarcinales archaeon]|nr:hypothetical protein [Methanosarcinales archaeon]
MAQFFKKFRKFQHLANKIKPFMKITILVIIVYYYLLISLVLLESVTSELNFLRTMDARFLIPILLLFSTIISSASLIVFSSHYTGFEKIQYFIYLKMVQFNSFYLLPIFLFSIGFLFITFIVYNRFFFDLGMFLFLLGIILFYIIFLVKKHYERTIYYMLQTTNNIFDDLSENKMDNNAIKKLNVYFKKTINNIDEKLGDGLNINELKTDEDETLRVKSVIINYLPLYLKFGKKKQIDSLKKHIYSMSLLVEKNDDFSLNIIKNLIEIYNDINSFFDSKRFLIIEKGRHNKLSIVKDNSYMIFGTFQLIIFTLYLYLYGPSPIP